MDLKLKSKLALVSGSTAGIGYAIAESLAREGAHVIVNGRSKASAETAPAKLRETSNTTLYGFAGDLSTSEAANEVAREHPDYYLQEQILCEFIRTDNLYKIRDAAGRRLEDIADILLEGSLAVMKRNGCHSGAGHESIITEDSFEIENAAVDKGSVFRELR